MNRQERYAIWFVALAHTMVHMFELAIPVLVTVWISEFAVNRAVIGTIVTVGYGLYGVGALPGGILADRYDSQRFIVASMIGMAVSFLLLSLSTDIVVLTVALALWGLAGSIYHPTALALLSRAFTERGKAFGYHGIGANAGTVAGPLVMALLLLVFDWQVATAVLAAPSLLVAAFGIVIDIDETAAIDAAGRTVAADGSEQRGFVAGVVEDSKYLFASGFAVVLVVVIFNGLFYRGLLTFLPDILGDLISSGGGEASVLRFDHPVFERMDLGNYLFSGILVIGMFGQYVGGRLTDHVSSPRGLTWILGLLAVMSLVSIPAMSMGLFPMLAVAAVISILLFGLQPFAQVTVAEYTAPGLRGISYGYMYLLVFGVGAFAASIVGYVLAYSSIAVVFLVLTGIAGLGSLASFLLLQSRDLSTVQSDGVSSD